MCENYQCILHLIFAIKGPTQQHGLSKIAELLVVSCKQTSVNRKARCSAALRSCDAHSSNCSFLRWRMIILPSRWSLIKESSVSRCESKSKFAVIYAIVVVGGEQLILKPICLWLCCLPASVLSRSVFVCIKCRVCPRTFLHILHVGTSHNTHPALYACQRQKKD